MTCFLKTNQKREFISASILPLLIGFLVTGLLAPAGLWAGPKEVKYPVSQFADGEAYKYMLKGPRGIVIRFFILKSSDGVIRAAFDACDVCWPANKGYTKAGDDMVCNNCGLKFPTAKINEVKGGCNPSPLKRKVKNGEVIINIKDILAGARYFDFSS
jgi:uncharacterized membrane protein